MLAPIWATALISTFNEGSASADTWTRVEVGKLPVKNSRRACQTFSRWLRDWLASERGYDWMVRELLTASSQFAPGRMGGASPLGLFYNAKDNKPEEIAATASRLFLGVNLGCDQCHNPSRSRKSR